MTSFPKIDGFNYDPANDTGLPRYIHNATKMHFRYVGAAREVLGCTNRLWSKIVRFARENGRELYINKDELSEKREVSLHSFLIAELPISIDQLALEKQFAQGGDANYVAFLSLQDAQAFMKSFGLDMASEDELDYITQLSLTGRLFPFDINDEKSIDLWMEFDLSHSPRTATGIGGLYFGEWTCSNYIPDSPYPKAIKGGGANFWPWQHEEWVWCVPTFRLSCDEMPEAKAALRPVCRLPR